MKTQHLALMMVGIALCGYVGFRLLSAAPAESAVPANKISAPTDTLHYAPGAEQLSFLDIQPVQLRALPVMDSLPGKIAFDEDHTVRVFAPVSGRVLAFGATLGSAVKSGDVLAWLASPEFAQALADSHKANSDLAQKRKAAERASALVTAGVVAQKDLEGARADFEQAQAEASRAEQRLRQLDAGKQSGDRYALRAPIDGMLVDRSINPGMEVRPDATAPLFIITDPAKRWASFELSERELGKVRVGQPIDIEVEAYPAQRFHARIFFVGAALDPLTRRVLVRAAIDNSDGSLRPEMFARISPLVDNDQQLAAVPNTALITIGLHHYVFVEETPGTLKRRELKVSFAGHELSYIGDGLKAGERIVTRGAVLLNAELGEAG